MAHGYAPYGWDDDCLKCKQRERKGKKRKEKEALVNLIDSRINLLTAKLDSKLQEIVEKVSK